MKIKRKHLGGVKCLKLDEQKVITGSDDKTVKIFDVKSGQVAKTIQEEGAVSCLAFHGNLLFTSTKTSSKITCFDLRKYEKLGEFVGHKRVIYTLSYNPKTKMLASGGFFYIYIFF